MKYAYLLFMVSLFACKPNAKVKPTPSIHMIVDKRTISLENYQFCKSASELRDEEIYRDSAYSVYNVLTRDRTYLVFKDRKTKDEYAAVLFGPCTVNLAGGVYYATVNFSGASDTTIRSEVLSVADVRAMKKTYSPNLRDSNNITIEEGIPAITPMENKGIVVHKEFQDIQIMDSFVINDHLFHLVAKGGLVTLVTNQNHVIKNMFPVTSDDLHSNIHFRTFVSQGKRITPYLNQKFAGYLCIDGNTIKIFNYPIPEKKV